jgi:hypothetical protein
MPLKQDWGYTRTISRCRFQQVEKGLGTRHGLKRIVVLLSKSITQEMTFYRLARRVLEMERVYIYYKLVLRY